MEASRKDFRNSIATVDQSGKRVWVYAKEPNGRFYNKRKLFGYSLITVLFVLPFIKVNGIPLVLFNFLERKFIILGIIFTPQDLYIFALMMIILMVFIALFTVVFGRVFCGWVCPQTIFMELVFRKIEYWIEGNANQQRKLNTKEWNFEKIWKKGLKHFVFFSIAFLIGNIFLSYIISVDEVLKIIQEPVQSHLSGFIAMLFFSLLFYGVFAFFREQVCIAACPYGRMQSVLLDSNSIVVIYDWLRGEPRGKKKRKLDVLESEVDFMTPKGDCVDCNLCVQVCPTGIDIRNGTQMECVNCTACIDACDAVMDKIGKPRGLIRYDSDINIEEGKSKSINARVVAYSIALVFLIGLQSFMIFGRSDAELVVQRAQGVLFQELENDKISNLYNFQIINKRSNDLNNLRLSVDHEQAEIKMVGSINIAKMQEVSKGSFFVILPQHFLKSNKTKVTIQLFAGDVLIESRTTNFLGPIK